MTKLIMAAGNLSGITRKKISELKSCDLEPIPAPCCAPCSYLNGWFAELYKGSLTMLRFLLSGIAYNSSMFGNRSSAFCMLSGIPYKPTNGTWSSTLTGAIICAEL